MPANATSRFIVGKADQSERRILPWITGGALFAVLTIFAVEQSSISAVNGWWADELSSLWASDPHMGFGTVFASRIAPDSNTPIYYSLLYWVRTLVPNDRAAIITLNVAALFCACAIVLTLSVRTGRYLAGFVGVSLFVLSGPELCYVPEGRSYFIALSIVFVASWYTAILLLQTRWQPSLIWPLLLGISASLTHLFAALACGALAAALLGLSLFQRNRTLTKHALTLGLTASLVSLIWVLLARDSYGNLGWITFEPAAIKVAMWEVKHLAFGSRFAALTFGVLVILGLMYKTTRILTIVFMVALALFFTLPILVSFKFPIITGRYWMIGTPLILTMAAFLFSSWRRNLTFPIRPNVPVFGLTFAAAFFVVSCVGGFIAARESTAMKPIWRGAEVVGPLLHTCHSGSIPVLGQPAKYALMSKMPEDIFFSADTSRPQVLLPEGNSCAILGWAEHVLHGDEFLVHASDAELLQILNISAPSGTYVIKRHSSGFVALRSQ